MFPSADGLIWVQSKSINSEIQNRENKAKVAASSTDAHFYVFHVVVMCGLGCLVAYCVYNGDLNRIRRGYDDYGNICGRENIVQDDAKLTFFEGFDMRMRPYLLVYRPDKYNNYTYNATITGLWIFDSVVPQNLSNVVTRVCLAHCRVFPNYLRFKKRCILKKRKGVSDRIFGTTGIPNIFMEVAEDLNLCWQHCLYIGLGSSVLSFVIVVLFSIFTKAIVWFIIIATVLVSEAFTIYMWYLFVETKLIMDQLDYLAPQIELEANITYLIFALASSFVSGYLMFIILTKRNKMEVFIQLYKEIIKSVKSMRLLLFQPVVTCLCVSATISVWIYSTLWIESSGNRLRIKENYVTYVKDSWNYLARWYNIIAPVWMILFFLDCQHMIVARAVSLWYFDRDKNNLGIPISYALYNLVVYHLGSVSLGSFLTLLVVIPRTVLKLVHTFSKKTEEQVSDKCCFCYLRWRENVLKYFTRDAYIEIVIYRYSFRKAGRQAFVALTSNDFDIAFVKGMGNFVLYFAQLMVSFIAMLIGVIILQKEEDLLHIWAILIITGIIAYVISNCFFSLYQSIIDTIFVCFCEDCSHQDGVSKPYYTTNFLKLIECLENNF